MRSNWTFLRAIFLKALAIGAVAYGLIIGLVLSIPHLPLADKTSIKSRIRVELTLERYTAIAKAGHSLLLVLGSSVAEHGISEGAADSVLRLNHVEMRTCNAATSGMFARANIANLRTMLACGIKPQRIVYGFFLQELNGKSTIHDNTVDTASERDGLLPRTPMNLFRFAPGTISILLNPSTFRTYIYLVNDAFRESEQLTTFQRILLGTNAVERDSTFQIDPSYVEDFKTLIQLCNEQHIPLALFNTPLRPTIRSVEELPYAHDREAYTAIEDLAIKNNIPLWNADVTGLFTDSDFLDNYHLQGSGTRKLGKWLGSRVVDWEHGLIIQDVIKSNDSNRDYLNPPLRKLTALVGSVQ